MKLVMDRVTMDMYPPQVRSERNVDMALFDDVLEVTDDDGKQPTLTQQISILLSRQKQVKEAEPKVVAQ